MMVKSPNRAPFYRWPGFVVLKWQALAGAVIALILWCVQGPVAGYSGLLGSLIALLPNAYFVFRVFRYYGARSARAIVNEMFSGEAGKLILTAVLFIGVWLGVSPLEQMALFTGYLAGLAISASAPLLVKSFPRH